MFARKSTGLVREGSWIDSFIFDSSASFFFGPLIFALSSLAFLKGIDLISAEGIALLFALAIAAMYAILTALMPRSGGDYVFNTRVLHPAIGFSFSFSLSIWQMFSAAFTLFFISYVALSPGLQVLGFYLGIPSLGNLGAALGNPLNSFVFATVINILFTLLIISGIKKTFRALDFLWGITILAVIMVVLSLISTTPNGFQNEFNNFVRAINGSGTSANAYQAIIQVGSPTPPVYALSVSAVAICASSVIWVFWETYVSGEVRRASQAKRNISTMGSAAVVNGVLFMIIVFLLYSKVGSQFLAALTSLSYPGQNVVPFTSSLQSLSAVLVLSTGSGILSLLLIVGIAFGYAVLLLPALYLQPIRSIFAWSFDRVVPSSLSSVNDRFHTPIVTVLAVSAIVEAALALIAYQYVYLLAIFAAVIIAPAFSSIFPTSLSAIALRFRRPLSSKTDGRTISNLALFFGIVSLAFIIFLVYVYISNEAFFFGGSLSMLQVYLLNFALIPIGAVIYALISWKRRVKQRINLEMIASEIPPE
jgi:basic amino acid/polyamine antiporter, APA family